MKSTILEQILANKRIEIDQRKQEKPLIANNNHPKIRDFLKFFQKGKLSIIAEIKKASPSKGVIRKDFDPIEIAKLYEKAGASAISVLTDEKYFMGSLNDLKLISEAVSLPLLRKDFIIDPYQIEEAYYAGASAVLIIVSALNEHQIKHFIKVTQSFTMTPLVEVHNEKELEIALESEAQVIGINNRDLKSFHTDLKQTEKLFSLIPKGKTIISESGINTNEDIGYLKSLGVDGALIGEAFMREKEIEKKVRSMVNI